MNFYNINNCNLDETQINAIEDDYKYIIVVAGAGSGKTLTILGKIKYLIEKKQYKEDEILCISFTNETVASLKEKLLNMNYDINVLTFHKLGLKLLNNDNFSIVNDNYLDYIIDEYMKSYIYFNKKNYIKFKKFFYTNKNIDFNSYEYYSLKKTISTFIKLSKSNNYTILDIFNIYKKVFFNEKFLMKMILDVYMIYTRELESINKIDFDDMIIKAIDKVKDYKLKYKYIIIDEFQDTSKVRFDLIKEIIKYTDASLFVVGDDWQSIYRFSGCDLDLFINFDNYVTLPHYHKLKYTYRNSNQLIYVSSNFIMKNRRQVYKNIIGIKDLRKPIKIVFNHTLEEVINYINGDYLILGRNNVDIQNIDYDNKLTIHRSKGLECQNVILVNSDNIPSTIQNESVLRHVLNNNDYLVFEEERRLFYVALTRTKDNIYIIVNKKISPFVKELISNYKDYIEIIKK